MLFVVMLGGKHPRAKIEVHDIAFVVADTLEAAYPQLRDSWFGSPKGVHIDSWMAVDGVESWRVELSPLAPLPDSPRLYFINLGGYESQTFWRGASLSVGSRKGQTRGHVEREEAGAISLDANPY